MTSTYINTNSRRITRCSIHQFIVFIIFCFASIGSSILPTLVHHVYILLTFVFYGCGMVRALAEVNIYMKRRTQTNDAENISRLLSTIAAQKREVLTVCMNWIEKRNKEKQTEWLKLNVTQTHKHKRVDLRRETEKIYAKFGAFVSYKWHCI